MDEAKIEEVDEVVEEMDVYLNGPIAGSSIMLLQCPESVIPTETAEFPCKNGRIKPGHRVELELELPKAATNEHFDRSKSRHLAQVTENARQMFPYGECNKLVLASNLQCVSSLGPSALNFAMGVVEKGALYLTPISYMGTLGPTFSYMDTTSETPGVMSPPRAGAVPVAKPEAAAGGETGESSQDEGTSEQTELQPIRARYARIESAEAKQRRLGSYDYFARKQAVQPWVNFTCHSAADAATIEQKAVFVNPTTPPTALPDALGEKLARNLFPQPSTENPISGKQPEISMNMIRALPPCDQIRALLRNVKVLQYQQVVPLWPRTMPATELLQTLQQYATLIQGCWVVKSEELYPPSTSSPISGVPAENLNNGRDFVLWCFTQARWQMRKDIVPIIKLPIEDVKTILEQVARPTARRGWEFLLPYDHDFVVRHPDVAQRQAAAWDARFHSLQSVYKIPRDWEKRAKATANERAMEQANSPPKRKRSKSRSSISLS